MGASIARVHLVLFDAREDPVEIARYDAGMTVFAVSGHADAERCAALGAGGIGACAALGVSAADERPVFGVGALALAASVEEPAVVGERVVEARREDAHGDGVVPGVGDHVREVDARDARVFGDVARPALGVEAHEVAEVLKEIVAHPGANAGKVARRPALTELVENQADAVLKRGHVERGVALLELREARVNVVIDARRQVGAAFFDFLREQLGEAFGAKAPDARDDPVEPAAADLLPAVAADGAVHAFERSAAVRTVELSDARGRTRAGAERAREEHAIHREHADLGSAAHLREVRFEVGAELDAVGAHVELVQTHRSDDDAGHRFERGIAERFRGFGRYERCHADEPAARTAMLELGVERVQEVLEQDDGEVRVVLAQAIERAPGHVRGARGGDLGGRYGGRPIGKRPALPHALHAEIADEAEHDEASEHGLANAEGHELDDEPDVDVATTAAASAEIGARRAAVAEEVSASGARDRERGNQEEEEGEPATPEPREESESVHATSSVSSFASSGRRGSTPASRGPKPASAVRRASKSSAVTARVELGNERFVGLAEERGRNAVVGDDHGRPFEAARRRRARRFAVWSSRRRARRTRRVLRVRRRGGGGLSR